MPIPWRVIFPACVSLITGLWALAEWRGATGAPELVDVDPDEIEAQREARERRQAAADQRAERALALAEQREARLANRQQPEQA